MNTTKRLTSGQVEFLQFIKEFKLHLLEPPQRSNIVVGLTNGEYDINGLRRQTFNLCRDKWLSEYKIYKETIG